MKMNIILRDKNNALAFEGEVEADVVNEAHLVQYQGKTYGYQHKPFPGVQSFAAWVKQATYRECNPPVVIDGVFEPKVEEPPT